MDKNKVEYVLNKYMLNSNQKEHCNRSVRALIQYICKSEANPNEFTWNRYAIKNKLLSAESMGYIYGIGFNKLCKEIRKDLK